MSFNCQYIPIIIMIIISGQKTSSQINPNSWEVVEELAEQQPYIVALLDETKNYSCTGSIINKHTVLTSGSCVSPEPRYVAVGVAVISNKSNNNIMDVAYTILHEDYTFELKTVDLNVTKLHSNIGLVFVVEPILQLFIPEAVIGNYYASELKDKRIVVVGYGLFTGSMIVGLQQQAYHQSPCANPKWYYCVCGIEYSTYTRKFKGEFGKGAPVLLGTEIIGITASPCGLLSINPMSIHFNIFTVIGPYMAWIEKAESNATFSLRTRSNSCNKPEKSILNFLQIFLLCIKTFT